MMSRKSSRDKTILKEEAPKDEDVESTFQDMHNKLFYAKEGTFMVRIKPMDESPPEDHLNLLYTWFDPTLRGSIPEVGRGRRTVNNHIYV
jgi:hypothetical protein